MSPGLARIVFWIAAVSCVIAHGALIRSVLMGAAGGSYPDDRRKQSRRGGMRWGPDRRVASADNGPSSSRELEIGWAILPAVALAALLIATWLALPH
ncbi:MAG: hypothetical protein ACR2L6_03745 [Gemmatimonadaceae bacterium]